MKPKKNKLSPDSALNYPVKTATAAVRRTPSHDEIASRAYWIWVELGYPSDRDLENWLRAERELLDAGPAEMPRQPEDLDDEVSLENPAERVINGLSDQPQKRSATSP